MNTSIDYDPMRPDNWSPKDIEQGLRTYGGIVGQEKAVKAASLIIYNHFEDRPSVNLFIGQTGSGKTKEFGTVNSNT